MFLNRKAELSLLENLHAEDKPKLILLYGKRRVGKTELLNEFAHMHRALYLVARQEAYEGQLKKMSSEIAEFFDDDVLRHSPFQNYDALFIYLAQKETPVLFDEFPYLVEANRALPSILQEYWDRYFSKKKTFLVLCGSSIAMMESLLGYKSPLYGRRTEQILLEPLKFREACEFFPQLGPEDKVLTYAVLGGTPAYLLEFDYGKPILENIRGRILKKNTFLYQDTMFVLQQELSEPRVYYSIINSVAKGNTRLGEIMNDTGLEKSKITKYLSVLKELHIIERRVPVTEKSPESSKKGIYLLKDNYFKFWFRFVFENVEYIEQGRQEKLIGDKISPVLNNFAGFAYEEIVLEYLKSSPGFSDYIFGRWWDKEEEIDVVGLDSSQNRIIFGEVKWKALTEKEARQTLNRLVEKSVDVKWGENLESGEIQGGPEKKYLLVGKKVGGKKRLLEDGYLVLELDDLVEN
ncbi:putative ATPase (AAA+ superfamily) [Methanosarcina siciliae HI350]|uniref:Putative ATPase (AAA+ superfamily) n=1 Tax=Methanosarcina siciliae HI350 TaxID=1434119 RepID=A0A0E3LBY0_9EURY|nr:ATP-binding protein [Methanosarcina siciliae]AKB34556.1 putative ATPase (AAA+ superfamily) [Methanosarcina siciliae HI350]